MAVPSTWNCTLRPEWQCRPHCHSTSSVPRRCVQGRVAVPTTRDCTLRPEWQCRPHCHSTSNVRAARPHTATRRRTYQDGALRAEWKCHPHGTARSGPSGSAAHTATRRRTYGLHALTLPLDVERTETVRSGPSGSADHPGAGRVGHRRDQPPATCRALLLRRPRKDAAGDAGRRPLPRHAALLGVCRPPGCRERRESDERREAPERAKRVAEARGEPGGATARGARGTCARQEPPRVRPGPARRPRRCERCAEIDEYVAQK